MGLKLLSRLRLGLSDHCEQKSKHSFQEIHLVFVEKRRKPLLIFSFYVATIYTKDWLSLTKSEILILIFQKTPFLELFISWGEWPSGLRYSNQIWKVPGRALQIWKALGQAYGPNPVTRLRVNFGSKM